MHVHDRTGRMAAGCLLGAILVLGGCGQQNAAQGPPRGGPPEVAVVTLQTKRLTVTTELAGRTSANRVAEVRPQVGGIIQKRLFTEGADVKAGQELFRIDAAPFQAAYDNAAANLAATRKAAERARAALRAGLAGVARQQATLNFARTNLQRLDELAREGAVSASQRDQAATETDVAEAAIRAAEAQVASDRAAVAAAEAAIDQAEAALETFRINLGYTAVTAPISGRIGRSGVTEGALVTSHQPVPLAIIQQLDPIYVDLPQSATDVLRLRRRLEEGRLGRGGPQSKVRLILEDGTAYPEEGTLQFRDVTVDTSTGSVNLRAVFPNPQSVLLPGMFVRATVAEGVNPKALLLPQQAVSRDHRGNPRVFIIAADEKVQQRSVTLDRAVGDAWLVSSGLAPGERVIVEGMQRVRPGVAVKAVPFERESEKQGVTGKKTPPPPEKPN